MKVSILTEQEDANGWRFDAAVTLRSGASHNFALRLSWVDYNLWSPDGADRPEAVARAALRFLLAREPAVEIADSFDAARIRRRYPEADREIPRLIR